jgi:hypothetical protein
MKAVYLFFLSFYSLLAGAHYHAYGQVQIKGIGEVVAKQLSRTQHVKANSNTQLQALMLTAGTSDSDAFFVYDEDDDNSTARIYYLLSKYALVISFELFLCCLHSPLKTSLPLCNHLSYLGTYKYLLQRSLRI